MFVSLGEVEAGRPVPLFRRLQIPEVRLFQVAKLAFEGSKQEPKTTLSGHGTTLCRFIHPPHGGEDVLIDPLPTKKQKPQIRLGLGIPRFRQQIPPVIRKGEIIGTVGLVGVRKLLPDDVRLLRHGHRRGR